MYNYFSFIYVYLFYAVPDGRDIYLILRVIPCHLIYIVCTGLKDFSQGSELISFLINYNKANEISAVIFSFFKLDRIFSVDCKLTASEFLNFVNIVKLLELNNNEFLKESAAYNVELYLLTLLGMERYLL